MLEKLFSPIIQFSGQVIKPYLNIPKISFIINMENFIIVIHKIYKINYENQQILSLIQIFKKVKQTMQYEKTFGMDDNRTPIQCKNGPLQQRKCTDILCCLMYLILIGAVIAFAILSANALSLPRSQIQQQLKKSQYGSPFIALTKSFFQICLALLCVAALCLIMLILSFLIPELVAYIFIPISLILILLVGAASLYIYFGQNLPFLAPEKQALFLQHHSWLALGIGILLLATFFFIIFVIVTKKQRFRNVVPVLKIARACFWQNIYILPISCLLTILSVVIWYFNIYFLQISQDKKDTQHYIDSRIMSLIIIVQILWTHGFMEGISDFIFESIGIFWYFNKAKYGQDYSRCGRNCSSSCGLLFKHLGTIVFGGINAYIPQQINAIMKRFSQSCTQIYDVCCFCHKFTIRKLSKYGYCQTILQSHSFCDANIQMYDLKKRTKNTLPQLYMQGNFFMTICKTLILMFSLIIVYFLLIQQNQQFYFHNILNLIVPLLVTLFASSQICNHFINATGLIGDTIVFMYTVDLEIQKKNFGSTEPYSCPEAVQEIIRRTRMNQQAYPQL